MSCEKNGHNVKDDEELVINSSVKATGCRQALNEWLAIVTGVAVQVSSPIFKCKAD
jgi:hypothetical protein